MKTYVSIPLYNHETISLFNRTFDNGRNFFDSIQHKIHQVLHYCKKENAYAWLALNNAKSQLEEARDYFNDEVDRLEGILSKKMKNTRAQVVHEPLESYQLQLNNSIMYLLIQLIENYDQLISKLKLLRLANAFESQQAFFNVLKKNQKIFNRLLSELLVIPVKTFPLVTLNDVKQDSSAYQKAATQHGEIPKELLIDFVNSTFGPALRA